MFHLQSTGLFKDRAIQILRSELYTPVAFGLFVCWDCGLGGRGQLLTLTNRPEAHWQRHIAGRARGRQQLAHKNKTMNNRKALFGENISLLSRLHRCLFLQLLKMNSLCYEHKMRKFPLVLNLLNSLLVCTFIVTVCLLFLLSMWVCRPQAVNEMWGGT